MKRILFTVIAFMFAAMAATAQINFGIKAGANLSTAPTEIVGIKHSDCGWFAGPTVKAIAPLIGVGAEANILYSNTKIAIDGDRYAKQSIEIPLYLRYELQLPAIKKFFEPFIAIGPQWGRTVGKREFGINPNEIDDLNDIKEFIDSNGHYIKFHDSCWSLNIGLGFILFNHLQVHANYNWALSNTCQYTDYRNINLKDFGSIENGDWVKGIESRTNIWQISLAYIF